jgi:CubicO group peptidase (beta-lactamase class C family)
MSNKSPLRLSRRDALAGLASAAACWTAGTETASAEPPRNAAVAADCKGPNFTATGPDAELYGAADGYPVPDVELARRFGNPWEPKYRVGAFSHIDAIYPTRRISRAATPWTFKCSPADVSYQFRGQRFSFSDYMSRKPITGLLVCKDDQILFESYQYGRTDHDRFVSQSMVKSIMGILIGIVISEGAIKSVDDTAAAYVPGLKGTEYGATPIRDLLHMSSGVDFGEDRDQGHDLNQLWKDMVTGPGFLGSGLFKKGTVRSIAQFNRRIAPPGTRYYYASIEPDVLGMVLHYAVGKSASDYLREKVWEPIGAEADAKWLLDAEGFELAHFGFNAVLRDYARFGRLLAHDGAWEGKQIIPSQWMVDATTVRPSDAYLLPGRATKLFGFGYLFWLFSGNRRQFAMVGYKGQYICVDPISKLVMVQTALDAPGADFNLEAWSLWAAIVEQHGSQP